MAKNNLQTIFLKDLFCCLNNKQIDYCIMRNYEGLPESNNSKDVDILIERKSLRSVRDILKEISHKNGAIYCSHTHFQAIECHTFYDGEIDTVKVDFFFNFEARGAKFLSGREILDKRRSYKSFFVADGVHDAIISWLKPMITGGVIKEKYRKKIETVASERSAEFKKCLTQVVGGSICDQLMSLVVNGQLSETVKYIQQIRRSAWVRSFLRAPLQVLRECVLHFAIEIKRQLLFPQRKMIAVIGPDGTGKSTVIERLSIKIPELCREDNKVRIYHFRPNLLPNLKKLFTFGMAGGSEEFTRPHRAQPSGFVISICRLLYYWTDYITGYLLKVRPIFAKGKLAIFDRYFYDFIVDPARSRVKLPRFIPMFLMKLVPKPILCVYLDNDVETILTRKQELPPDELSRQLQDYRKLVAKFTWFYKVDSRKPIDEVVREISVEYMKRIARPINEVFKNK